MNAIQNEVAPAYEARAVEYGRLVQKALDIRAGRLRDWGQTMEKPASFRQFLVLNVNVNVNVKYFGAFSRESYTKQGITFECNPSSTLLQATFC